MIKPTLCIYHGNCVDGFTAAWVVWKKYGDAVQFHPGVYDEAPPNVRGHDVLIVDFSYKRAAMAHMAQDAKSIMVLGHRKTVHAEIQPLMESGVVCGIGFSTGFSGSMLTWLFVMQTHCASRLVAFVEDQHLRKFELPGTREIDAYIRAHDFSFSEWDILESRLQDPPTLNQKIGVGHMLLQKQMKDIRDILPIVARTMVIGGVEVPVANLPYTYASEAGHILAEDAPFAACYYDRKDARVFSLRSRPEGGADVSVIAARYGGGGHRNAAGFEMPIGWEGEPSFSQRRPDCDLCNVDGLVCTSGSEEFVYKTAPCPACFPSGSAMPIGLEGDEDKP